MSRSVKTRSISAAPDGQLALVVRFTLVTATKGADGKKEVTKENGEKTIRVRSLDAHTNVGNLARNVVEKCKYINESKLEEVEKVLHLMQYKLTEQENQDEVNHDLEWMRARHEEQFDDYGMDLGGAMLDELDSYMELLYEDDIKQKIKGTWRILQLARNPDNLELLLEHDSLLTTISRVLHDEAKRSTDLALNIIYVYWCISNFSQLHGILGQFQAGATTMKMIELEIKRDKVRREDFAERAKDLTGSKLEAERKLFEDRTRKQDRLLYVCFHVLLNLAEDLTIEKKMKKRNMIGLLNNMLERKNIELLILVCTFLKKLSIFKENKDDMREENVVSKLAVFIPVDNPNLMSTVLRLLLNLSFDGAMRLQMVEAGLIPRLVDLLKSHQEHLLDVLRLLYHLSVDDRAKSMFTYTDSIPLVLDLLMSDDENVRPPKEVVALAINLASNPRNAEVMCQDRGLHALIERAFRSQDPLLMKVIRNIASHDGDVKMQFADYIVAFIELAKSTEDTDMLVEVLGVFGNLNIPDFNFMKLLQDFDLIPWLSDHLQPGQVEDDIILEAVIFIGTITGDEDASPLIANSSIIHDLFKLMQEKQDDDEMVLQLTYVFYRFLIFEETREVLLTQTQAVFYLIDLLSDKNYEIQKLADQALEVVQEFDDNWARKIRQKRFEAYNSEWLEATEEDLGHYEYDEDDSTQHLYERERVIDFAEFDNAAWDDDGVDDHGALYWNDDGDGGEFGMGQYDDGDYL